MNNDEVLQRVQESIDKIADGAVKENLKRASEDEAAQNSTSNNSGSPKCYCCGSENVIIECGSCKERRVFGT